MEKSKVAAPCASMTTVFASWSYANLKYEIALIRLGTLVTSACL